MEGEKVEWREGKRRKNILQNVTFPSICKVCAYPCKSNAATVQVLHKIEVVQRDVQHILR